MVSCFWTNRQELLPTGHCNRPKGYFLLPRQDIREASTRLQPVCYRSVSGRPPNFPSFFWKPINDIWQRSDWGLQQTRVTPDGEEVELREIPDLAQIDDVLEQFRGLITQIPPMYSALKVDGKPLYKLAREGKEIERKHREVMIHNLELVETRNEELVLDILCSKGTYIRTLAEDIGEAIGCGAHICALRRLQSGPFSIEETVPIEKLMELRDESFDALDQTLLPVCSAVKEWPLVELTDITASYFRQGHPVQVAGSPTSGWVRLFNETTVQNDADFIGVGEILDDGKIAPRRLVVVH